MFFSHLSPQLVTSLQGTSITLLASNNIQGLAIANLGFTEGIHYWEIVCPYNTEGLKIGISKHQQCDNFEGQLYEFKTSTQRIVGVLLNFNERSLQFYLNGNLSTNKGIQKGTLELCLWYPCIQMNQYGNQAYLHRYENRSIVEHVDRIPLTLFNPPQTPPKLLQINNNSIYRVGDSLISVRNSPLDGQSLRKDQVQFLEKMGLVELQTQNEIVHLNINEWTIQQLFITLQYLRYTIQSLKEHFQIKTQPKQKDELLKQITEILPLEQQENEEQEILSNTRHFKHSLFQYQIAETIIVELLEQAGVYINDPLSSKFRLLSFTDHPTTQNIFDLIEKGYWLNSGPGSELTHCQGEINQSKYNLVLKSKISQQNPNSQLVQGKSNRYFSLISNNLLTIYNGEVELFQVAQIDLKQIGPYKVQMKEIQVEPVETPSEIYKILEKYINGETEQLPLYDNKSLQKLLQMGFDEEKSKSALLQASNNLNEALELISANEWQCQSCTLLNKETNLICEACESPRPETIIKQVIQPQEQIEKSAEPKKAIIIQENQEINESLRDIITNGSITHVLQIHHTGTTSTPLIIASVHNQTVLSLKSLTFDQQYLDQFFVNEEGYYCRFTNQWLKTKNYSKLLSSEGSKQIVETLAPLYGRFIQPQSIILSDHNAIQLDFNIVYLDYVTLNNKLYLLLLGQQQLNIYLIKELQLEFHSSYHIDQKKQFKVQLQEGNNIEIIIEQNSFIIKDNLEMDENNQKIDELIKEIYIDDEHQIELDIPEQYLTLKLHTTFEAPIQELTHTQINAWSLSDIKQIPLVVNSFSGASLSNQTFVTQMLYDQNKPFVSNYPKPEYIFCSQFNEYMLISQVEIKSDVTTSTRGFPIGAGLIFIANNKNDFSDTTSFDNYTQEQYQANYQKFTQPYQPVGYFEFKGEEKELICKLNVLRPCKYIMLKPTNFRKSPFDHTAHFDTNSVEIKYFSVSGKVLQGQFQDHYYTVQDSRLIDELRKRINIPKIPGYCRYFGHQDYPSNGIVEIEIPNIRQLCIKQSTSNEVRLLKVSIFGKKSTELQNININDTIEEVYQRKAGSIRKLNLLMKNNLELVAKQINLLKFIMLNILNQEINEQIIEFMNILSQYSEYDNLLLSAAEQILQKIEKLVITESGLEYFIELLIQLGQKESQKIIDLGIQSLQFALQKLKSLSQQQDVYLFTTKFENIENNDAAAPETTELIQQQQQSHLIPIICNKDPLSQILVVEHTAKFQIRRFEVNLLGEFELQKLSLRFQQTSNFAKFRVQVWSNALIIDKMFDESTFVQFTDFVHRNPIDSHFNCLHIDLGGIHARHLVVQITIGGGSYYIKQKLENQIPQNALTILPEFYGKLINEHPLQPQIEGDFRYKSTLLIGDILYYAYESENSQLLDSYNIFQKTDLTDHYIMVPSKTVKRNADYLENAIRKLQSEMVLKSKCGLPNDHIKRLIEQTQLELLKVQQPRNYENNLNFLRAFAIMLIKLLSKTNGKYENALSISQLILSLGDLGQLTDICLQFIQNNLRPQISQWTEFIQQQIQLPNSQYKRKILMTLELPLIESLDQLLQQSDDILYDAIVFHSSKLQNQDFTQQQDPKRQQILSLAFLYLVKDFRLSLIQTLLPKCTAEQIKQSLTLNILEQILHQGIKYHQTLKPFLELLSVPHQLENKYIDWAATLLLNEQTNELLKQEKDNLTYLAKFIIFHVQQFIQNNLEKLSLEALLTLFDFLAKAVKRANSSKLRLKEPNKELTDFGDFLQRQHIQVCYPNTIERLIAQLQNQTQFHIWSLTLKVVLMLTPSLQNEQQLYKRTIDSYIKTNNKLLQSEIIQFTINLSQQEVQQNQTCSLITSTLLKYIEYNDIQNIFIIFAQKISNIHLSKESISDLLLTLGICLRKQIDSIEEIANIQQLELIQQMFHLILQSEQCLQQIDTNLNIDPILEWYSLQNRTIISTTYVGSIHKQICEQIELFFEFFSNKKHLLERFFQRLYYIDNTLIPKYKQEQISTNEVHRQCSNILDSILNQFDKHLINDNIAQQIPSDMIHYLIEQIIKEKQSINLELHEQEFANKMSVKNLPGQNIQNLDWSLHKKGAKSRLALLQLSPGFRSEYCMQFEFEQEIEIKQIKLGIQTFTTDFQDKILGTPNNVLLEVGQSLQELEPLSQLTLINDEYYTQFSVKFFMYNGKNANKPIKFMNFRIGSPLLEQIEGSKFAKKQCIGISFISVLGYSIKQQPIDFIYSLQEKASLELLSKFCRQHYTQTLRQLANDQNVLQQLKLNIGKFMSALGTHSLQLSSLMMAISKYNHEVGDWLVDKLMEHPEPQHCKLLTQIILEGDHTFERFQRLHNYLFPKLLALQVTNYQQQDLLLYEKLASNFIDTYCNVLLLSSKNLNYKQRELTLNINKNDVIHLISLIDLLHSKNVCHLLIKLVVNITYLPHPFIQIEEINQILLFTLDKSKLYPYYLEMLGPLALGSNESVDWMIKELDGIINRFEPKDLIQFVYTLSVNSKLADNLIKHLLFIYKGFIETNPKAILKQYPDKTLEQFTKFISYMVQKYHAKFIIEELIKDIRKLETLNDMRFVRQLLVPLLNFEDHVFLSLQFIDQGKYASNPHLIAAKNIEISSSQIPIFESQLLDSKQRDFIIQNIKESCWNKVGYQKNDGDNSILTFLEDKFFNQSKILWVINYKLNNQDKTLVIYLPNQSKTSKKLDTTYKWDNTKITLFYSTQNNDQKNKSITDQGIFSFIEIECTAEIEIYDGEGTFIFWHKKPFLEIEYIAGDPSRIDLTNIGLEDKGTLESLKIEYFIPGIRPPTKINRIQDLIQVPRETTSTVFSFPINQALNYYSVVPVYEVPSHLKVCELKQFISVNKNSLKEECNLLDDQRQLSAIPPNNRSIIELQVDALTFVNNLVQKTHTQTHTQSMSVFPIFEELNGVNAILSVIRKGIQQWKNYQRATAWLQFIGELESFCLLPNFFNLFMKNNLCVNLLFDLMAGSPDQQNNKKWDEEEQNAVKFIYATLVNVFSAAEGPEVRIKALEQNLIKSILDRIALVSKETKRSRQIKQAQEIQIQVSVQQVKSLPSKGKKGIGYASDNTGQNQKWNTIEYVEKKNQISQQLIGLLGIVESFFDFQHWHPSEELLNKLIQTLFESALLPLLESAFRSGSLLEISKEFDLYTKYLRIVQSISQHKLLASVFLPLPEEYNPKQTQSIQELLTQLAENAQIFLNCMSSNVQNEQNSLQIAKLIIETHKKMESCISKMNNEESDESNDEQQQEQKIQIANALINEILNKPIPEAYRMLLSDLRFDYIDMKKQGRYKHHYATNISNQINQDKIVRLAQEFADMSNSLPIEHTNAIFVRADKERVDVMKALVMGAKGTPYANGAFLFDIYADDSYPSVAPKMNLSTTGNGKVRFNPNLYNCGKVCLSLLGTWRGNASENWDPKISTLLQVLVSTQAIIMSEDVYFNEPGFEQEANTEEGERKNEGYSNIVRYCNIKYAMIDQMRDPPPGFESIIRRHFYIKKQEILEECKKWIELAETKDAVYTGLLSDHNASWCSEFKKGKKVYQKKLEEAVKELEDELNKLQPPSAIDLANSRVLKTHIKKQPKVKNIREGMANLDEVDVSYNTQLQQKDFNSTDASVLDRWSRYIGAMGVDAVKKQANSSVLISGIGPLGIEVAKNIVLSGVKTLTLHDINLATHYDLTGQFFIEEKDLQKNRAQACVDKVQQLNSYVRVNYTIQELLQIDISQYNMIIVCITYPNEILFQLNQLCRQFKCKLIISSVEGVFGRVFNDFGDKFIVEDKNGEQITEHIIKQVKQDEKEIQITLISKHDFQDDDLVYIDNVEGLIDQNGKSINKTVHKIKIIDKVTIIIQQQQNYTQWIRNGTVKLVKVPTEIEFKPYNQNFINNPIFDNNMSQYDYDKLQNIQNLHKLYNNLEIDYQEICKLFEQQNKIGEFPPLSAFLGGFVAQECIKGLTQKFMPVQQLFYVDCSEVLGEDIDNNNTTRSIQRFVGKSVAEKLEESKIFMVGCGAIGCELLKNFAMINLGIKGCLTITDPDHIEVSNLNRQFLFREQHLRKPKSQTAAAAIIQMNPLLKNHIIARLDKVHDQTEHIYTDQFFEELTIVTNALDNVAARRYVDKRCVDAHIPLIESGTLGPKGHVQCVIPFQTESYGSSNDPVEEGEIPYCTLKMFPEETFHCVEFARDKFGKHFSLRPKQLIKMMQSDYISTLEDNKALRDGIKLLKNKPQTYQECIQWARGKFEKYFVNDIKQLMYTYPEDAKTKDGNLFWTMPKRPPKPTYFDPENELHQIFVTAFATLKAKMFGLNVDQNWRSKEFRKMVAEIANKIIYPEWHPSEEKKKNISDKVQEQNEQKQEEIVEQNQSTQEETQILFEKFKQLLPVQLNSDEFEKDNDSNGHIDFIYSFGNLRAANYKLEYMDWLTVKIKAGRIVPALATTTAVVAGLQTIELIKTIKGIKLASMKNAFVNLAIPFIQLTEPGAAPKKKINSKVTVTLWDRWEIKINKSTTLGNLFEQLSQQYELHPCDVFLKAQPIYMEIMYAKKQEEKKHILNQPLIKLIDIQKYVDLTINFTLNNTSTEIIKGIPLIRLTI